MATNSVVKRNLKILGAGFVAVVLTLVAGGIWSALLTVNLRRDSTFPWSAFVMAAILWAAWQYYSGKWWGTLESKRARGEMMRAKAVSSTVFGWSFLAGISAVVALAGLWIVLSDVIKIPGNPLPDFSTYSWFTIALVLVMASLVSSIAEEVGIRGYFQGMLEKKVTPFFAVAIPVLAIAPGHGLTQGFVWPTMLFYVFADVAFGVMANLANSIVPGIFVHSIGLLIFFTLVWPFDTSRRMTAEAAGHQTWFWLHIAQALFFGLISVIGFVELAKTVRRESREHAPVELSPRGASPV